MSVTSPNGGHKVPPTASLNLGDAINTAGRHHEFAVDDWPFRDNAAVCHRFFDNFNVEFFEGQLPPAFCNLITHPKKRSVTTGVA